MVSYKYEVDLSETHIKVDDHISGHEKASRINQMEQRKQQKKASKYLFVVFLLGLVASLYFLYRKSDAAKEFHSS